MLGSIIVIGLQAVAPAAGPPDLELKTFRAPRPCPAPQPGDDIVICAKPGDDYRLKSLPPRVEAQALPKAEVGVFGKGKLSAETEAANVGGFVSNRAMVRLKMPF